MFLENLDNGHCTYIAPFNLSGDFLIDSDNIRSLLSFSFNLWSDENMSVLLATSEI